MRDVVSEIKAKISILDLVSEYVVLKKTGSNYKGLSPFKPEKTPSFIVSPEKGIAYCFSTNRGGDIFRFLMEVENIEFAEALKILAEKSGIQLGDYQPEEIALKKTEKQQLLDLNEVSCKFFENYLANSEAGQEALKYLNKRGLTTETIRKFRLGLAPDSFDATNLHLLQAGFDKKLILSSGMAMAKDTSMVNIYDRFRGRLIFPVMDSLGRVVGFGGRAMILNQEPKYLNSPETALYQKSSLLYGFQVTKAAIKEKKEALVVEGYMDFLAAWQNGLTNVVAVNGTALTMRHLALLKPYIDSMVLAFDMDSAGREAVRRAFELVQEFDWNMKILELPAGVKDIADFCLESAQELKNIYDSSAYFADYFYAEILKKYGFPDQKIDLVVKKKIIQEFAVLYHKMKSNLEKETYLKKLSLDLSMDATLLHDDIRAFKLSKNHPAKVSLEQMASSTNAPTAEEKLLGMLIEFQEVYQEIKSDLLQDVFSGDLKEVYIRLVEQYNSPSLAKADLSVILKDFDPQLIGKVTIFALYAREKYGDLTPTSLKNEVEALSQYLLVNARKKRLEQLQRQLRAAEESGDLATVQHLLTELQTLYR